MQFKLAECKTESSSDRDCICKCDTPIKNSKKGTCFLMKWLRGSMDRANICFWQIITRKDLCFSEFLHIPVPN